MLHCTITIPHDHTRQCTSDRPSRPARSSASPGHRGSSAAGSKPRQPRAVQRQPGRPTAARVPLPGGDRAPDRRMRGRFHQFMPETPGECAARHRRHTVPGSWVAGNHSRNGASLRTGSCMLEGEDRPRPYQAPHLVRCRELQHDGNPSTSNFACPRSGPILRSHSPVARANRSC